MTGQHPHGSTSADPGGAPVHPADFWEQPELRAASRERHFGRLLRAYRLGQEPPVQQTHLAGWLGITQGQLSRIERALTPVRDLAKLAQWARVLHIPGHLLWFEVSPDHPGTPLCLTLGATLEEADQGKVEEGDGVRRRELLKVAKAAGVSAVTGSGLLADAPWQRLRDSLDKARPVDAATVQLMHDRTADFFDTEYTVP
ncbi:MAG: helix-turn-helix domain-containing protein, partial [Pseudonocardiales bacterium]|nr:helix-turn-helix domain-containing protein [Pseudonocardiales bacterium]